MADLTIALVQPDIHWENVDANLAALEERLWSIQDPVDFILLPETFNAGFTDKINQIAEVPGLKTQKWLLQMARQKKAVIGGSYLVREGQKIYNRFLAAMPDGSMHSYDKKHLFNLSDIERSVTAGTERTVFEYKGWRICPMICYDLRFPIWSRNTIRRQDDSYDYDLLIYAANWPDKRIAAWDALLRARAIENQSFVAGINRIGADENGLKYPGHSAIYDYAGMEMQTAGGSDTIIVQKIEKAALDEFRTKLPFLRDE